MTPTAPTPSETTHCERTTSLGAGGDYHCGDTEDRWPYDHSFECGDRVWSVWLEEAGVVSEPVLVRWEADAESTLMSYVCSVYAPVEVVHREGCARCARERAGLEELHERERPAWDMLEQCCSQSGPYLPGYGEAFGRLDWCAFVVEHPALFVTDTSADPSLRFSEEDREAWTQLRDICTDWDSDRLPEVQMHVHSNGDGRLVLIPAAVEGRHLCWLDEEADSVPFDEYEPPF
ncbi:MAG: hypothetical protein INR66_00185 [Gordonia polyisoprenivorans]|nr:hypothetical protein [Gordonia polyisoprenivorans]